MEIVYSTVWEDYTHNGGLIHDLEKFIATALSLGETIKFKIEKDT